MKHRRLRPWVKNLIFLLVAVLLISTLLPTTTAYAKDAIGSKLTLEKIDGNAYVINSKGKKIAAKKGVKLSAGEGLQTEAGSYAYISLDDSKVVKLDELSEVTINKSGKKLCVEVEEGSLFFEVTEKLEDDESLQFKAGSMAMSIRGTAGVISLRRKGVNVVSGVELLDGRVDMVYGDVVGENHAFTMWGGETIVHNDGSSALERELIDITEIEGFAAVEIKERPLLADKVLKKSGLNANYASEHAEELLKKDQEYNKANYYDVFEEGSERSVRSLLKKEKIDSKPMAALPTNSRVTTKLAPVTDNNPKPVVAAVVNNVEPKAPVQSPAAVKAVDTPVSPSPAAILTPDPNIDWEAILKLLYPSPSKKPAPQPVVYSESSGDGGSDDGGSGDGGYWDGGNHEEEPEIPAAPSPTPSESPKPAPQPPSDPQPPVPVTKYKVTFYGYDEIVLDIQDVVAGNDATPPEAPEVEGYIFGEWRGTYTNVKEDMRIFASYVPVDKHFVVSFYDNFNPENPVLLKDAGVVAGEAVQPPEPPSHNGVVFEGWSNDGYKRVVKDLDVYTVYKSGSAGKEYIVTFKDPFYSDKGIEDGVHCGQITVKEGQAVTFPEPPTHAPYSFVKWEVYGDGDYNNVTCDMEIWAVYDEAPMHEGHTIDLIIDGEEVFGDVNNDGDYKIHEYFQNTMLQKIKNKCRIGGCSWNVFDVENGSHQAVISESYVGPDDYERVVGELSELTIDRCYAIEIHSYLVVYLEYPNKLIECKVLLGSSAKSAQNYEAPPATYNGKSFAGWDDNLSGQDFNHITDNCTFTAKYEASSAKQYRLRVIWCDAPMDSPTINYWDAATGYDSTATVLREVMVDEGFNATSYDYQSVLSEFGKGSGGVSKSQPAIQNASQGKNASSMTGNVDIICW